jgi:hypothetical protein
MKLSGFMKPAMRRAIRKSAILLAALFLTLFVGLSIGYVVLGHRPLSEVFSAHTWTHLYNLVFGK